MNCPTCDNPMVWSTDRNRLWCAVYGDHRGRSVVLGTGPISEVIRLDVERERRAG